MNFAAVVLLIWMAIAMASALETRAIKPEGTRATWRLFLSLTLGQVALLFIPMCVAEAMGRDSMVAYVRVSTQYYLVGWVMIPVMFLAWWGWNWLWTALILRIGGQRSWKAAFFCSGVLSLGYLAFLVSGVRGPESLEVAVKKNDRKAVQAFLNGGGATQREIDAAFEDAPFYADADVAVLLLDHGADLTRTNSVGRTALDNALMRKEDKLVHELIKRGALKDAGPAALHFAAEQGNVEMVKLLLDAGGKVDDEGGGSNFTPLMDCMDSENAAAVARLLLDHGADPNRLNKQPEIVMTPLDRAVCTNHIDLVRLLLEHGARINDRSRSEMTPLISACLYGYKDIAQLLLEKGARTDLKDKFGRTAESAAEEPEIKALFKGRAGKKP